jgi:hypothetical protein
MIEKEIYLKMFNCFLIFFCWVYLKFSYVKKYKILKSRLKKYENLFRLLGFPFKYIDNVGAIFFYKGDQKKKKAFIKRVYRNMSIKDFEFYKYVFYNYSQSLKFFNIITVLYFIFFFFFCILVLSYKIPKKIIFL